MELEEVEIVWKIIWKITSSTIDGSLESKYKAKCEAAKDGWTKWRSLAVLNYVEDDEDSTRRKFNIHALRLSLRQPGQHEACQTTFLSSFFFRTESSR